MALPSFLTDHFFIHLKTGQGAEAVAQLEERLPSMESWVQSSASPKSGMVQWACNLSIRGAVAGERKGVPGYTAALRPAWVT